MYFLSPRGLSGEFSKAHNYRCVSGPWAVPSRRNEVRQSDTRSRSGTGGVKHRTCRLIDFLGGDDSTERKFPPTRRCSRFLVPASSWFHLT